MAPVRRNRTSCSSRRAVVAGLILVSRRRIEERGRREENSRKTTAERTQGGGRTLGDERRAVEWGLEMALVTKERGQGWKEVDLMRGKMRTATTKEADACAVEGFFLSNILVST
jgi:hypothetical protein